MVSKEQIDGVVDCARKGLVVDEDFAPVAIVALADENDRLRAQLAEAVAYVEGLAGNRFGREFTCVRAICEEILAKLRGTP